MTTYQRRNVLWGPLPWPWSERCVIVNPFIRLAPRCRTQDTTFNTPKTHRSRRPACNCAWNGARASHCRGRFVQILCAFDKLGPARLPQSRRRKEIDWGQEAADNYQSKHSGRPFRPIVFLISQMWSTLAGESLTLSVSLRVLNCFCSSWKLAVMMES